VLVPMRDGVRIAIDIYRPRSADKLPALLAFSIHNKDLQVPELAEATLTHPAWSMLWTGPEAAVEKSESEFANIAIPTYTGSGWYGSATRPTYAARRAGFEISTRRTRSSCCSAPPISIVRCKRCARRCCAGTTNGSGIETGILHDPPVRFWVMGANAWRSGGDWPLPETQWIAFYLRGWERLTTEPFTPASADDYQAPMSSCRCRRAKPTAAYGGHLSPGRTVCREDRQRSPAAATWTGTARTLSCP
jgi:hypothetical protein